MSAFIVALAGCHKEDPAEKAGKAVDNATEKAAQQIVKADDNIQDTANGDKKSECRNDKMGYQTSFKLTIPIRLKVRCSVKRPLECPLRGAGVGRLCKFANVWFAAKNSLRAMTGVAEKRKVAGSLYTTSMKIP